MNKKLTGQTVLITGAAMGIGEAIAREMAAHGAKLILVDRIEGQLKAICEELSTSEQTCRYVCCDLTQSEDLNSLCQILFEGNSLDGIVHNAGLINYDYIASLPESEMRELFEVNFFAILSLTQKLIPLLEKSRRATIAMISSAAAWRALPMWSIYCASKAAITSWAEALRMELRPKRIRVVTIYPGVTKTKLSDHTKSKGPKPFATTEGKGTTPQYVARKVVNAYEKGRRDDYVIFFNKIYRWLSFLFPKLLDHYFYKYYQRKGWL